MRVTGVQLGASLAGKLSRDPVSMESVAGSTRTGVARRAGFLEERFVAAGAGTRVLSPRRL